MSFSRWYPVSNFYYDPAIQPSKAISNLQTQDETRNRKIPKGRYDTTYRREYLNFHTQNDKLNPYALLPPINNQQNKQDFSIQQNNLDYQSSSIDHIIAEPQVSNRNQPNIQNANSNIQTDNDNFLPINPVYLNQQEEQSLINDVSRELGSYSSEELKRFYSDLTSYDPYVTGFTHYTYVSLTAMRNNLPISDSLLRFLMSRYVSPNKERGFVNYEELVKFLAKCQGDSGNSATWPTDQQINQYSYQSNVMSQPESLPVQNANYTSNANLNTTDKYDPDEQAILRLMHENMKDWDQVNLIDCDNLRKKFYEIDPFNRYILTLREFEDVLYKNRVPIQRSLLFQILEKYCKLTTGQYRWPAFVDFLEKIYSVKFTNNIRKPYYTIREDEKDIYTSKVAYRSTQLDILRSKASEEERIEEINKQIYNLQNLKQETQQRIESRLDDIVKGESWFTRFMRFANAMYSHRVNTGMEFSLPKDEARQLINAYNTVYELNISNQKIEDGLNRCTFKGNVIIDNFLKFLAGVN